MMVMGLDVYHGDTKDESRPSVGKWHEYNKTKREAKRLKRKKAKNTKAK
jgi:hypothetical protein